MGRIYGRTFLCPWYTVNIHFLTCLENPHRAEPHFLFPNMQSVISAFISVHVLRNLYSSLIGPIKKKTKQKKTKNNLFLFVFKKLKNLPQTLNPIFPFSILELYTQKYSSLSVVIDVSLIYIRR